MTAMSPEAPTSGKPILHKEMHRRKGMLKEYYTHRYLLLMLVPGILYYIVFKYLPMYGIILAFKDFRIMEGVFASPWIGFKHFSDILDSPDFWFVFRNTLVLSFYKLIFSFPAPIILALLLNEVRAAFFKKFIQTITYLPHFLSWIILSGILMNVLSPSTGIVNVILTSLGFDPIFFFGDADWFRTLLVSSSIWKEVGWGTIIYLAALAAVDPQQYEAAVLDGANKFQQTIHVTLPAILPMIIIMFIFAIGGIVNDDFDQIFNMYNPAVYSVSDVLSTFVYRMGLENMMYSFSTAAGLFKNIIAFALVIGTNYIVRKYSEYGLW
ncbi:ABC transporter permease [Paenibacillus contaminans]|nr:ABC transporter permease subunit [Paenibacillus contaminans]